MKGGVHLRPSPHHRYVVQDRLLLAQEARVPLQVQRLEQRLLPLPDLAQVPPTLSDPTNLHPEPLILDGNITIEACRRREIAI